MREADTRVAKYVWPIIVYGAVVVLAVQGGFAAAQFHDGALPQIPIQAIGGGEVRFELTVSSSGVVSAVKTLRATPPFTDAMGNAVRGWLFRPAEEETEPKSGKPADPKPRRPVESKVLVVGIFRAPTLNAPTFGEPPMDVASASSETPFPLASVMPSYPLLARENGIVLVEVRVDPGGGVADVKVIRSAPPFDEPARDAARRWTFRPARVSGRSVAGLAYIVFAFRQPITVIPGRGSE
jgi:TonB family protein